MSGRRLSKTESENETVKKICLNYSEKRITNTYVRKYLRKNLGIVN